MNADFYMQHGMQVVRRDYGTRVWDEMFTIYGTDGERLLEIRRKPKSSSMAGGTGILDPLACHVRLCNRTCYFDDAVDQLRNFLVNWGYTIIRISRVDIALDFERFDYGDNPEKFLLRYLERKYSKINQADIAPHGRDAWDGRKWNSISWGSKTSCINTKFYNKTLELQQVSDKPYIRQAWWAAGLIDDWHELTKRMPDGTVYKPTIWRVEFSIKSGTRNWFLIEDQSGKRVKKRSIRNTLSMYDTKQKLLDMFMSLAEHYFHFKKVEYINDSKAIATNALTAIARDPRHPLNESTSRPEKRLQRKDRCQDKLLFRLSDANQFYKLENVASAKPSDKPLKRLIQLLMQYRETHLDPDIYKACNTLLESMMFQDRAQSYSYPWPMDELTILRQVISKRIKGSTATLDQDLAEMRALLKVQTDIFGEVD